MQREQTPLQKKFYDVIFGTSRGPGRNFDIILILLILASVAVVMLDSIPRHHNRYGELFLQIEWVFTAIFTLEYVTRIWCSPNRKGYVLSGFGIVDLLAILPTYLAIIIPGANSLLVIRLLRILRIFRVLRLLQFLTEANVLARSIANSRRKIFVFFSLMLVLMTIFGCLMYVIEGPVNGFRTIPESIYWAIVTMTTVGYGDVSPLTPLGQLLATLLMILGYAIIAVPTGIVSAELVHAHQPVITTRSCPSCTTEGHLYTSRFCRDCGAPLADPSPPHDLPLV